MSSNSSSSITILRLKAVMARTGLSRSTIYELGDPRSPRFDPTFPRRFQITRSTVGWVEQEVIAWLETRIASARVGIPMSA